MTNAEFEVLVKKHYPRMLTVAQSKLRSLHDAEDAVQRALLNLWHQAEHLDASERRATFSTLLVRATLAAAVDIIRERVGTTGEAGGGRRGAEGAYASRQRTKSRDGAGGGRRVGAKKRKPSVVDPGLNPKDMARLHEAMALVPPEYAAVMWEVYGHGAKIADLAREMGMEPATLRQKLHRFKKDVREALGS